MTPTRKYSVFLSHAGPDKESIAIPLYERLRDCGISAFVDREELHPGDIVPRVMEYAMKTAPVGVFILSPEFAVRKWTMDELMCFQKREREALEDNRPLPILIPVFYSLDVHTCGNKTSLFHSSNETGENPFHTDLFVKRARRGETSIAQVADSIQKLATRTGIENHAKVSNAVTADMQSLRSDFIDQIVREIKAAVTKTKDSGAEDDAVRNWRPEHAAREGNVSLTHTGATAHIEDESFTPHFEVWNNPHYVFLSMSVDDPKDPLAPREAKARHVLLNESDQEDAVVAIHGMAGVGKTCLLRALCHDGDIRARFADGVYLVRLGADAGLQTFLQGLGRAVEASGGHKSAAVIRQSQSLATAANASMKWFAERTCLFLLDDVWSKPVGGIEYLEALSSICAAGKDSALVFSTREKQLLSHKRVTHEVCLTSHDPRGSFSRSVLLRTATRNAAPILESSTHAVVNHLLDACGGIPVALVVIGRAIFKIASKMSRDYDLAIPHYFTMFGKSHSSLIDQCADDDYVSLTAALHVAINILVDTGSEDDVLRTSHDCAGMYRSLCVLKKQQWVPVSMLCRLWNIASDADAEMIADKLSEFGLVDVQFRKIGDIEVKGIQLHDLVHDVATENAKKANGVGVWHARLLDGYASADGKNLQKKEGCREWWATERGVDTYVDENIVRHLIEAGEVLEGVLLVTRPQWIARQLEMCTILSIERDIDLLTVALETSLDAVTYRKDTLEGLRLVRNCIRAGLSAILENPREVYFQISARLFYSKDASSFAKRIVHYAERHALKPCLKAVSACVEQAESVGCTSKRFRCSGARCLHAVEEKGVVLAGCEEGEVVAFDMESCERKARWKAHEHIVNCLAVTRDRRFLVSGSRDKTAKVWDMRNDFAPVAVCKIENGVQCVDVTPDNQHCVVGDEGGTVSVWALETGRCVVHELGKHVRYIKCVRVSPDGQRVASGVWGEIKVWSMNYEPEIHCAAETRAGSEGNLAASSFSQAFSRPSQSPNTSLVATLAGCRDFISTLCFTRDGRMLISGSQNGTVKLWDTANARRSRELICGRAHYAMSVSHSAEEQ